MENNENFVIKLTTKNHEKHEPSILVINGNTKFVNIYKFDGC